jgi:hypothetical protein
VTSHGIWCSGRMLASSNKGYLCLASKWTDSFTSIEIWLLLGAQVFYVTARSKATRYSVILGEGYLHGLMDVETLEWPRYREENFEIVIVC